MSNKYAVTSGPIANTAGSEPIQIGNSGASNARGFLYEFVISCSDSPGADNVTSYVLQRFASTGAGTGLTEIALDPGSPAAIMQGRHSASPVVAGDLFRVSINQRVTFRWVNAPNAAMVIPAAAGNGIALSVVSAGSAYNLDLTMMWQE